MERDTWSPPTTLSLFVFYVEPRLFVSISSHIGIWNLKFTDAKHILALKSTSFQFPFSSPSQNDFVVLLGKTWKKIVFPFENVLLSSHSDSETVMDELHCTPLETLRKTFLSSFDSIVTFILMLSSSKVKLFQSSMPTTSRHSLHENHVFIVDEWNS